MWVWGRVWCGVLEKQGTQRHRYCTHRTHCTHCTHCALACGSTLRPTKHPAQIYNAMPTTPPRTTPHRLASPPTALHRAAPPRAIGGVQLPKPASLPSAASLSSTNHSPAADPSRRWAARSTCSGAAAPRAGSTTCTRSTAPHGSGPRFRRRAVRAARAAWD